MREPTVAAGTAQAAGGALLTEHVFARYYQDPDTALPSCGLRPEDLDAVSFDHLHVQGVRMIMGSTRTIPGERAPRQALFPRARLLVHRGESGTFASTHPAQWAWYVDGGMAGVPDERVTAFDGDVELEVGVSLLWPPGHTDGDHSLVLNTPDGVWVSSENGISADNWRRELSRIPGVCRHAAFHGHEVVPNADTHPGGLPRPVRLHGQGDDPRGPQPT